MLPASYWSIHTVIEDDFRLELIGGFDSYNRTALVDSAHSAHWFQPGREKQTTKDRAGEKDDRNYKLNQHFYFYSIEFNLILVIFQI